MIKTWRTPKGTDVPLLDLRGKPYLQVAHRLVWFREEKPTWSIITSFVQWSEEMAFAKAEIISDDGHIMACAHKREDRKHFADYAEKAESGAVGRALAYVGYGTQFCADELDEKDRILDAPIPRVSTEKQYTAEQDLEWNADKYAEEQLKNAGDFICIIGKKFKNFKIKDIPARELKEFVKWIKEESKEDWRRLPDTQEFLFFSNVYMSQQADSNG